MGNYALIIGIEDYPQHRSLQGAVRDAKEVKKWLTSPTGGNVLADNCKIIKSKSFSPEATDPDRKPGPLKKIIDDTLLALMSKAFQDGGGERFYFYFSGHGIGMTSMNNALCLADWSLIRRNSNLSSEKYFDVVINSQLFEEVVFIFDCCRDSVQSKFGGDGPNFEMPPKDKPLQSKLIAYATQFGNPSFEAETGNTEANMPLVSGLFTRALLEGLNNQKAIDPTVGQVTSLSLGAYLEQRVPELAKINNRVQKAEILTDATKVLFFGQRINGSKKPALMLTSCQIDFSPGRTGLVELQNGTMKVVATHDPADGPLQQLLVPGLYRLVEVNPPQDTHLFVVQAQTGIQHVNF